jgi:hypothetical protein
MFTLFGSKKKTRVLTEDHAELLARYERYHHIVCEFQRDIPKTFKRYTLQSVGEMFGLLDEDGTVCLGDENELFTLVDYALYDMPKDGLNAAAHYLCKHPQPSGSDRELVLKVMACAQHSVVRITRLVPDVGFEARDMLRDRDLFVMNRNLGATGAKGLVLASRLLHFPGMVMSTGADLVVSSEVLGTISSFKKGLDRELGPLSFQDLDPASASIISTLIIDACLRSNCTGKLAYAGPGETADFLARQAMDIPVMLPAADRIPRNRPCPCGSGRKYKHCCAP